MITALLFLGLGMQEIIFIAFVVLLFFGGKKLPELMQGLGKGVKSFKDGMDGIEKELNKSMEDAPKDKSENKEPAAGNSAAESKEIENK